MNRQKKEEYKRQQERWRNMFRLSDVVSESIAKAKDEYTSKKQKAGATKKSKSSTVSKANRKPSETPKTSAKESVNKTQPAKERLTAAEQANFQQSLDRARAYFRGETIVTISNEKQKAPDSENALAQPAVIEAISRALGQLQKKRELDAHTASILQAKKEAEEMLLFLQNIPL